MLKLDVKKPRKFISPLLSKKSVTSDEIAQFNKATIAYLTELEKQRIAKQTEPNIVSNALKPYFENLSYVAQSYSQNGQSGIDLALMLEHSPSVIIEAKAFESSAMITKGDINKKALHEAIYYFMNERHDGNNTLYHIIVTDFYNWFVFDAQNFENLFWKNREIKKIFDSVKDPSVLGSRTEDFYSMVSEYIEGMKENLIDDKVIDCAYFDLRNKRSDKENIALYKLLSKDTLQKAFNPNDANTLNRVFYSELLYILGLEEQSSGGKKLISRAKKPNSASLYENIARNLKLAGHAQEFETIIRLMIIWINRILFLKLLESQLIKWNDDKDKYSFLNAQTIHDFDRLKIFFFDILANKPQDRDHKEFTHIPYLNSSLFEMNEIEKKYIDISSLEDNCELPYYKKTVLKDAHAKRKEGSVNMLHYLFDFLDAYDFSSEGSEELVSESKSLINASVLGLIFEKLNGYKDGSFYTPSFITMYMSKETITKAIIEKFNQVKGWSCNTLDELDDKIEDKKEANDIIDSLTICDPAVGSGHFLVSSLNTILEIKSELRILFDAEGKRIKDYELSVENDELIVRDDEGEIFEYKRGSKEKTRIQKMLFLEKQKIIENSLFGVDINPNSTQITRLRLWIELLKNSYYAEDTQLVTMPNIDINIKVGNSLISRYGLDDEIDIPNIKHAIERYKTSVREYKEGSFLSTKDDIRSAIDDVKGMFGLTLQAQWSQTEEYKKQLGKYVKTYSMDGLTRNMQLDALDFNFGYHGSLFGEELNATKKKEKAKLLEKVIKSAKEIEEIEKGKVYEDAFEWRFEFPEVLDEEGNFVGFDVVIGNPPYIPLNKLKEIDYSQFEYQSYDKSGDILALFFERGFGILNKYASMSLIVSNSWLKTKYGEALKNLFDISKASVQIINFEDTQIFEEATVETCIVTADKSSNIKNKTVNIRKFDAKNATIKTLKEAIASSTSSGEDDAKLMQKIEERGKQLKDWDVSIYRGVLTGFNKAFIIDTEMKNELIARDPKSEELLKPMIRGRDVQKYVINWEEKWLINSHNNPPIKIDKYSAIKDYLDEFYPQLEKRYDKGVTPYNLRNCAYLEEFEKPKIVWGEISDKPKFAYDESGMYVEATSFMMTGEHLKYLLSILNSNLSQWYFERISTTTGMGTNRWKKFKLELLPIVECEKQQPFITLADKIIILKKQNQDTSELEAQIDQMVYALYELSDDEVALIEGEK